MTTQLPTATGGKISGEQHFASLVPDWNDSAPNDDYVVYMVDANVIVIKGRMPRLLDHRFINMLSNSMNLKGTELPRFRRMWGGLGFGLDFGEAPGVWSHLVNQLPESASGIGTYERSEMPESAILALKIAFDAAKDEDFEDGMESRFSTALEIVIQTYGDVAVKAIANNLNMPNLGSEVIVETLRQLGNIKHQPSRPLRREILLSYLMPEVLRFRDAASLGLAALDDPTAIPKLREAVEHEIHPLLKRKLQAVLTQLEKTQG